VTTQLQLINISYIIYLAFEGNTQANTIHHFSKGDGNLLRKHSRVLERNAFSLKRNHSGKAKLLTAKRSPQNLLVVSSPAETTASIFDVILQEVSLICLALLQTLETSEKKLDIYLPLNASTAIGASRHNKLIIRPTNFSGLFMCTWNATDKGKPKYLDKNLSSGQSGIETGFYPPILSYFILPLSFHKCSILTFHSCITDAIFSTNDSVANETLLHPFLRRTLRPSRFLYSRFVCILNLLAPEFYT
jgi:hypothetical protein